MSNKPSEGELAGELASMACAPAHIAARITAALDEIAAAQAEALRVRRITRSEQSDEICHDLGRRQTDVDGADAYARVHRHVAWIPVDAAIRRYGRSPAGFLSRGNR